MHDKVSEQAGLTYEDYCDMPDDGVRYELVEGVLRVSPSPNELHQRALTNIAFLLRGHVGQTGAGRIYVASFDVVLAPNIVFQPDVLFVAADRLAIITEKNVQGSPNLAVEILSESNRDYDLKEKRRIYASYGVPHYWIIDPEEQRVIEWTEPKEEIYLATRAFEARETFAPTLFPEISIEVAELFSM